MYFMGKKNKKEAQNINKAKLITFWSVIGLFTIAFVVILITLFVETRPIESYDDIKEADLMLVGKELFENDESEYLVYIFASDSDNTKIDTFKAEELKPIVFNYFNFVKQNSRKKNVVKIYGFDISNYNNRSCVGTSDSSIEVTSFDSFQLNEKNVPMLLRFSNGEIESRNIQASEIQEELQSASELVKTKTVEALIEKRKFYWL